MAGIRVPEVDVEMPTVEVTADRLPERRKFRRGDQAEFEVAGPDGKTWVIAAPIGSTDADVLQFAEEQFGRAYAQRQVANDQITAGASNPAQDMSTGERAIAGWGSAVPRGLKGIGQLVGMDFKDELALDRPLLDTTAGNLGNLGGNIAMYGPAAAARAAGTVLGGAGIGAGIGLTQPVEGDDVLMGKGHNALLGGGSGGAFPLLTRALSGGKAVLEPAFEGGRNQIVGRAMRGAAGGRADEIARALMNPIEHVPGSMPTAAEVAGSPGIAAMQRAAAAINPEDYGRRGMEQNAARVQALQKIAGDEGEREFYDAAREATGSKLYKKAFEKGIDAKKMTPEVQEQISGLMANPWVQDALPSAIKMARADGIEFSGADSLQGMHYLKLALNKMQEKSPTNALGRTEIRQVTQAQENLVGLMQQLSPAYGKAMAEYQAASVPINRMDIGKDIISRSTNNLDDAMGNPTVSPNRLAAALSDLDSTAQRATGFKKARAANILSPDQINSLEGVRQDVSRKVMAESLGRGAGSDTVQKLAMTNVMDQAGVPTFLRDLPGVSRVTKFLFDAADDKTARRLAEALLDPKQAAELMLRAAPGRLSQIGKTALQPLSIGASTTAITQKR